MDVTKTYWNNNGYLQKEYEQILQENIKFTKSEQQQNYIYYRFYNDGDMPKGSKFFDCDRVAQYLEEQANIIIAKRYIAKHPEDKKNMRVKFWAMRERKGFKKWIEQKEKNRG